jgi:hypothetical protein
MIHDRAWLGVRKGEGELLEMKQMEYKSSFCYASPLGSALYTTGKIPC